MWCVAIINQLIDMSELCQSFPVDDTCAIRCSHYRRRREVDSGTVRSFAKPSQSGLLKPRRVRSDTNVEVYYLTHRLVGQTTSVGPTVHDELQHKYWNLLPSLYYSHVIAIVSHQVRSGSTLQVRVAKRYHRLAANS